MSDVTVGSTSTKNPGLKGSKTLVEISNSIQELMQVNPLIVIG